MHPLPSNLENVPQQPAARIGPRLAVDQTSQIGRSRASEKKDQNGDFHHTQLKSPTQGERMKHKEDDSFDRALLARVAVGDMKAMRALYDRQSNAIYRFARLRLSDQFEVADIVHETMLSAWRSAGSFEGRSSVRSWLLRLARNKIVDHIRKQSRVALAEPDETTASGEPDAEAVISATQDAERVRACVNRLPNGQRAVIQLAFFEELTYAEVAEIEDIPEGTVKTRIYHAKKLLMRCLSRR